MVDNFDLICPMLEFPSKDGHFYFLQVLQRKKDFPGIPVGIQNWITLAHQPRGSNNNSRLIKAYYIQSVEHLRLHEKEIKTLCDVFGARAGINLNVRSLQKTAYRVNRKIADQMLNGDWYGIAKAYNSVCGEYQAESDKRWLVDIDTKDQVAMLAIHDYIKDLYNLDTTKQHKIYGIIPTRSGYHIICTGFRVDKFKEAFPTIEIHKNNPTLLYCP